MALSLLFFAKSNFLLPQQEFEGWPQGLGPRTTFILMWEKVGLQLIVFPGLPFIWSPHYKDYQS